VTLKKSICCWFGALAIAVVAVTLPWFDYQYTDGAVFYKRRAECRVCANVGTSSPGDESNALGIREHY